MSMINSKAGAWTRASIARERARDAARLRQREAEVDGGDPFPPGLTPEQIGGEVIDVQGWMPCDE